MPGQRSAGDDKDTLGPAARVKDAKTTLARRGPQISLKCTHLWARVHLYLTLHSSFPPSYGTEGTRRSSETQRRKVTSVSQGWIVVDQD